MMEFKLTGQNDWGTGANRHTSPPFIRAARLLGAALFLVFATFGSTLQAQCAMACNDDVNISLPSPADGCAIALSADMLIEDPGQCAGPYTVTIMTLQGNTVPTSPTVNEDHIGETLMYQVFEQSSGNSCWGTIDIEDKLGPSIDCTDVSIYCVEDTSPDSPNYPMPTMEDCSGMGNVDISYFDQVTDGSCSDAFSSMITRSWVLTDSWGNQTSCTQNIIIERVSLEDFTPTCPTNLTLQCSLATPADTDPSNTGYPYFTVNGTDYPIVPGAENYCEIASSYNDEVFNLCGGGQKILRTWTVYDWCLSTDSPSNPYSCIQVIKIEDNEAPIITCAADFSQGSVSSGCVATIVLPAPLSIEDGCSSVEVVVLTPIGMRQVGDLVNLPVGMHDLNYIATDECGNSSTCTVTVTIVDDTPPVAICDEHTVVSLTADGTAIVHSSVFDDGSDDNCEIDYFVSQRMVNNCSVNTGFDEYIEFCCADIGSTIMVVMRIFDTSNNYNECMIEVEVQDKIDPTIICPPNKVVECDEAVIDISNLSNEGSAVGQDNCDEVTISEETVDLRTSCGVGTIIRTFTATDGSARTAVCVQTINVINSTPFDVNSVIWPADYTTNVCGAAIEPNDLPAEPTNYREPVYNSDNCDLIAVTHSDTYLPINPPSCYKILRKWIVIDWCQYDPNDGDPQGYIEWTQIVKVVDDTAPIFDCPANMNFQSQDASCNNANITIDPVFATDDCVDNLDYSYQVDFYSDSTTDAVGSTNNISGNYPIGEHSVTISATDGCGNVGVCSFVFTITDGKKPTPVCYNGISVDLMPMGTGGMVEILPAMLNAGSSDNCTNNNDLILQVSPSMFTCNQVGTNVVILNVTDEAGNTDFCETYVIIQDNMNVCSDPTTGGGTTMLAGEIMSESGSGVQGVTMNISGNGPLTNPTTTDNNGQFEFIDLQDEWDYTITPELNTNLLNGVTTYDLVLIQRHVLGTTLLDSPYKMIAADVNHTNSITTSDVVNLRKAILGAITEFPNNNSWRFVDGAYNFSNLNNPFATGFPEVINFNNLNADQLDVDFMSIKVGDVNGTAAYNLLDGTTAERSAATLHIATNDHALKAGDIVSVPFSAAQFENVFAYQFTLNFDQNDLEFISLLPGTPDNMTEANFGLTRLEEGTITTSWDKAENTQYNTNTTLFTLTFKALNNTQLSNALSITDRITTAEAYRKAETEERMDIALGFTKASSNNSFALYQNQPNPFAQTTTIGFHLPEAAAATLKVYDMSGKVLQEIAGDFEKGDNVIELSKANLDATGVLFYQLSTPSATATRKMIVIE